MSRTIRPEVSDCAKWSGDNAETLFQQGLDLHRQGKCIAAKETFLRILESSPRHAGAWHSLGLIALRRQDVSDAVFSLKQAVTFCETNAVYWNNYGVALLETRRFEDAKTAFEKAVSFNGDYADAWSNLGRVQIETKRHRDAETSLQRALRLKPRHKDALTHSANLYRRQKRHRDCADTLERLLEHPPEQANAYHQLGVQLGEAGDFQQSKSRYQKAASLPGGQRVWRWKHLAHCPIYFDNAEQIDDYWHQLSADLDEAIAEGNIYDWRTLPREGFVPSFHLPHHNRCCREVKEKFTRLFAPSFSFDSPESPFRSGKRDKIRVGFLVTPGHEGGFLRYTAGIVDRLNVDRFEIVLIHHANSAHWFQRFKNRDDIQHVVFDWNFEDAVTTIRRLQCDVMYFWKAGADTWNFYLPMCRPASVQFTSWGTHGTSGIEHIDYSLSWRLAEIETAREHYTERLYLCDESPFYHPESERPQNSSRDKLGLPKQGALYFCPHRLSKYHPDYDFYLKGILENDPEGHVLLFMGDAPALAEKFKQRMRRNLGNTLMRRMISIAKQSPRQYHRFMSAATVLLDSHVYSGGITSYDAFSYDVPCVTQTGALLVQRYPFSSYKAMGIADAPVATHRDEYVRMAVQLGTDADDRRFLSEQIRQRKHVLFERRSAVVQFETFLENVVR